MQNDFGFTPMHVAAWHGDPYTVQSLLDEGADVDAVSTRGLTPLMLAVMGKGRHTMQESKHITDAEILFLNTSDPTSGMTQVMDQLGAYATRLPTNASVAENPCDTTRN